MNIAKEANGKLWSAFQNCNPGIDFKTNGYVNSIEDNLLSYVKLEDFKNDLEKGDGNELDNKFKAIHSSSALCVNCFAPFRKRIQDLKLAIGEEFSSLEFEKQCRIWPRATPPNLDVVLSGKSQIVAVEAKFTEYLHNEKSKIEFKPKYHELEGIGYFEEMVRIDGSTDQYKRLDAAQLIKHSFGLAKEYPRQNITLLYVYWEPANAYETEFKNVFERHRCEIEQFSDRVNQTGYSELRFESISYQQLWNFWRKNAQQWLNEHLDELESRYQVDV